MCILDCLILELGARQKCKEDECGVFNNFTVTFTFQPLGWGSYANVTVKSSGKISSTRHQDVRMLRVHVVND